MCLKTTAYLSTTTVMESVACLKTEWIGGFVTLLVCWRDDAYISTPPPLGQCTWSYKPRAALPMVQVKSDVGPITSLMLLKCHSQGGEAASWGRKFSAWVSEKYYRREYYFLQQRVKRQAQRIARQLSNLQNLYYLLTFLMIELYLTSCERYRFSHIKIEDR